MRPTRALLAALFALAAILGVASPAHAQDTGGENPEDIEDEGDGINPGENTDPLEEGEETVEGGEEGEEGEIGHAEEECIHLLEEGGTIDDCQAAPNPLLPETNEIIWGAIGFAIVFFFIWRVGFPAIKKGMDARAERIRNDLDAAEAQRTEAETILNDYRSQLADARNESARIIEEARQQADTLKRDQEARLQSELNEMRERATADIEAAKTSAIADLRGEVAQLAIGAAEVVVKRNLDQQSQVQLIEDYINQVTAQRG